MGAIKLAIGFIALWALAAVGWIMNVWAFCHLNFDAPYKAEIIRGIGIPFGPLGAIDGYITFDEERK